MMLVQHSCHAVPSQPQYFKHQLVDHTNSSRQYKSLEWTQRYYESGQHFQGAGSPIFLIMGGEGAIPPETGLFYPFVSHRLAKTFGAFVLQPEHRYYGESIPVHVTDEYDPRSVLLTPEQALYDAVRLTRHVQDLLLCSQNKSSPEYCPVISVGGSYPGFLSMAARLRFPHFVDISYAASAPVKFYAQQVHADEYYNHISHIAERCKPGCSSAVKSTLESLATAFEKLNSRHEIQQAAASLGFCPESVPSYMTTNGTIFQTELFMIIGYTFANDNMAYYPPDNTTRLYSSCSAFMDMTMNPTARAKQFFQQHFLQYNQTCIDMSLQLPSGTRATISAGDWSGVGTGKDGESWDFQTCTLLVEAIGFSQSSMFPTRPWTQEWLTHHCQSRFGISPQPNLLASKWHFDNLMETNVTRILFTNGLLDGWSVGGILTNISDSIVSLNFPNGAHHSDLSHQGPSAQDTWDIRQGFDKIEQLLGKWLQEIQMLSKEGGYRLRASAVNTRST
jgi:hypothetical protein